MVYIFAIAMFVREVFRAPDYSSMPLLYNEYTLSGQLSVMGYCMLD